MPMAVCKMSSFSLPWGGSRQFFAGLLVCGVLAGIVACEPNDGDKAVIATRSEQSHPHTTPRFGLGRTATVDEIAGWDIDIRPDGQGLPVGEGSVADGEMLYEEKCASCHGVFGEGEARWPKLAGGMGTLTAERPDKTVGSYWPYASTLYDYIRRAMPFPAPQSLSDSETYAITAYVLYLNDLVDDEFVLNQHNLATIAMPNRDGFFDDDRPDTSNSRCMTACREPEAIVVTLPIAGITPTDHLSADGNLAHAFEPTNSEPNQTVLSETAAAGKTTYQQACQVCHSNGLGGAPVVGDRQHWQMRIASGAEKLYQRAIEGFQGESGVMPAKGGQTQLSDDAVKSAVDYMVELSGE